jgi:hypothetical protein
MQKHTIFIAIVQVFAVLILSIGFVIGIERFGEYSRYKISDTTSQLGHTIWFIDGKTGQVFHCFSVSGEIKCNKSVSVVEKELADAEQLAKDIKEAQEILERTKPK